VLQLSLCDADVRLQTRNLETSLPTATRRLHLSPEAGIAMTGCGRIFIVQLSWKRGQTFIMANVLCCTFLWSPSKVNPYATRPLSFVNLEYTNAKGKHKKPCYLHFCLACDVPLVEINHCAPLEFSKTAIVQSSPVRSRSCTYHNST
jgi:hypothetical protein